MTFRTGLCLLALLPAIAACASPEPRSFAQEMRREVTNAAYTAEYNGPGRTGGERAGKQLWTPSTFAKDGGWPDGLSYGGAVEAGQCTGQTGLYACDRDGDGAIDAWGNAATGAFSSARLWVNAYGEAFSWADDCACWTRDPALDGRRNPADLAAPAGEDQ